MNEALSLVIANPTCACGRELDPNPELSVHVQVKGDGEYLGTGYCSPECAPEGTPLVNVRFDG